MNNIFSQNTPKVRAANIREINNNIYLESTMESLYAIECAYGNVIKEFHRNDYRIATESDLYILTESFQDFLDAIVRFFKMIKDKIVEFFKSFAMLLQSYFMDFDKFMNKYKNKLRDTKPDFIMKGYTYTIKKESPNIQPFNDLVNKYNTTIGNISNITRQMIAAEKEKYDETDNGDALRGIILGSGDKISKDDFLSKVKKFFRDDEEEKKDLHIDAGELSVVINKYPKVKASYKETQGQYIKIKTMLDKTITFFDKNARVIYNGATKTISAKTISTTNDTFSEGDENTMAYSTNAMGTLNIYFKVKADQAKEIASIIKTVFLEKLYAIDEELKQYRTIVRRSLFSKTTDEDPNTID